MLECFGLLDVGLLIMAFGLWYKVVTFLVCGALFYLVFDVVTLCFELCWGLLEYLGVFLLWWILLIV